MLLEFPAVLRACGILASDMLRFWIDLVSVIPVDLLSIILQSDTAKQMKAVRIVRLLRLLKLIRVLLAYPKGSLKSGLDEWRTCIEYVLRFLLDH